MMRKLIVVSVFSLVFSPLVFTLSYADNAEVLPKGVSMVGIDSRFYFPVDERYDPDGHTEDVAEDYNATLDSAVFPDLGLVEAGFGLPAGSANIGRSVISFEYDFTIVELSFRHGITDRLTVGIMIPYWDVKNDVDARLDSSNATVGANPFFGGALDPFGGAPIVPLSFGGVPLSTQDAQDLIGRGLDINDDGTIDIEGFGFKPVKSWSGSGLSDIEAGFRYQYLKTEDWRLAFTGGVRFPTGETDDPDDLMDYPLGSGAWALLFQFNQDYVGIKNLLLNATFRYDLILPDKETLRVLENVDQPLSPNKEKVDRDYGDIFEFEVSGMYQLSEAFSLSLLYKYGFSLKDDISGDQESHVYKPLEDETDYTEHVGVVSLAYSTMPLFKAKRFPIPVNASISYRNRFAGSNNVLKSEYVSFELSVFF
jgi:hypothetical protein